MVRDDEGIQRRRMAKLVDRVPWRAKGSGQ